MTPLFLNLGTGEIILIVIVVLLLFGAKRIPELARSLGKGVNSFKAGMKDAMDSTEADSKDSNDTKA